MGRNMVTRTIKSTLVNVLRVETNDGVDALVTDSVQITGTYKNDKQLIKAIRKQCGDDVADSIVRINDTKVVHGKYVIAESDFIACAELVEETED